MALIMLHLFWEKREISNLVLCFAWLLVLKALLPIFGQKFWVQYNIISECCCYAALFRDLIDVRKSGNFWWEIQGYPTLIGLTLKQSPMAIMWFIQSKYIYHNFMISLWWFPFIKMTISKALFRKEWTSFRKLYVVKMGRF